MRAIVDFVHGIDQRARLKDKFATHIVPFSEFESDAASGTLPDFSMVEPRWFRDTTTITLQRHGDAPGHRSAS